jgi:hypothetical protein
MEVEVRIWSFLTGAAIGGVFGYGLARYAGLDNKQAVALVVAAIALEALAPLYSSRRRSR